MKIIPILLIIFGLIVIKFPEILAYLIGGFFIVVGLNMLIFFRSIKGTKKGDGESYVKFGNYKIYR